MLASLAVVGVALTLAACGDVSDFSKKGSLAGEPSVKLSSAYYRLMPPGLDKTAAYLEIENESTTPAELVAVRSPQARAVEFHSIVEEGGQMRMRRLESLVIPASSALSLEPGGLHLMLFGVDSSAASQLTLQLEFAVQYENGPGIMIKQIKANPRDLRSP